MHAGREGEILTSPDLSRLSDLRFAGYFEPAKKNDGANIKLTEAEYFVLQHLAKGSGNEAEARRHLCVAWTAGRIPASDGSSLKGQRNLDVKAVKVAADLKFAVGAPRLDARLIDTTWRRSVARRFLACSL